MALPTPNTPFQLDVYNALGPLADQDEKLGFPLFDYTGAIASMFDLIELFARDAPDGAPGYAILMNPDRIPDDQLPTVLPWLGQFVGVDVDKSLSLADQRNEVKNSGGFKRGTVGSMIAAAQKTLTGTKTVFVKERDSTVSSVAGGAYGLTMLTLTSETPSSSNTLAAIKSQKPGGIILAYNTVTGMTWQLVNTNYASWNAVKAAFATWNGVRNNAPGT